MLLETKNLSIGYGDKVLHSKLNLSLEKGSVTAILGVNGSGKSTLIKTLSGFISPLHGEIFINDKNINSYSKTELASLLSVVLTDREINGGLRVEEVVAMGRYPYTNFFGQLTTNDNNIIAAALNNVGITHLRNTFIAELSDGERQKVMIAKSLAQEAEIIILDEPTSFLDIKSRIETISLLRQLAKKENKTFLLSLHDLELSLQYTDNLWIINSKEGVLSGITEELVIGGHIDKAVGNGIHFDIEKGAFTRDNVTGTPIKYEGVNLLWIKNILRRNGFIIDNINGIKTIKVTDYNNIEIDNTKLTSIPELINYIREHL